MRMSSMSVSKRYEKNNALNRPLPPKRDVFFYLGDKRVTTIWLIGYQGINLDQLEIRLI